MNVSIAGRADWLGNTHLQRLLSVLAEVGEEARVAGGAVRNALMGQPVADIDIATTCLPQETIRRAEAAGFKAVPTGIEHGTVTVIAGGKPYETTTLRAVPAAMSIPSWPIRWGWTRKPPAPSWATARSWRWPARAPASTAPLSPPWR